MKKIKSIAGWLVMAAALTIAMTACSNPGIMVGKSQSYTLTVEASKDAPATTRALGFDDVTGALDATWETGDLVYVYSVSGEAPNETLSASPVATLVATADGTTTTLIGKFVTSYTPEAGARLRLKFLDPDYATQDGTLDYIATHCDYATADVTIAEVDGKQVVTTAATFQNQQAIVRFSLKDKDTDDAIAATSLSIEYGSATYTVTPAAAASELYVAIPGQTDAQIKLNATVGTDNYSYKKTAATFENGSYYAIAVKMKKKIPVALNTVTSSQVGWRIGSDGRAYEPEDEMPEGVTAVAMICYVSGVGHGLAIELNSNPGRCEWYDAPTVATSGKTAVPGAAEWRLPSNEDWSHMFDGCNIAASNSPGSGAVTNDYTSERNIESLRTMYAAAGYSLPPEGSYWSSTGKSHIGHYVRLHSTTAEFAQCNAFVDDICVLACLAF